MAPHWKCGMGQPIEGSNPSLSATTLADAAVRGVATRPAGDRVGVSLAGRARWGTSGALYLQSAPAGLNSLPRSRRSEAVPPGDVEDRVPRSGESRTVSGPEGSSTQRSSSGAAERPGPSRLLGWGRASTVDGGCTAMTPRRLDGGRPTPRGAA